MTDLHPAVTVVVPTHHRPDLMALAVASVLDQDYAGDIEVVVVFDACDIELPSLRQRRGRTVRGLRNERTRGLAGARNTGIMDAEHEFVAFLDDDDTWLPGKLAAQMPMFEADPDAIVVATGIRVVSNGRTTHTRVAPSVSVRLEDLVADRIAALHSSSLVFRREMLIQKVGLIDEDLPGSYGEDYDVLLRTARIAPVRVVNEPLVAVRWTGQSYFYGQWTRYAEALRYLLEQHPEFRSQPSALARVQSQIAFAMAAAGQRRLSRAWARDALATDRGNTRAWLALGVSYRVVPAAAVARVANAFGKGI